MYDLRMVVDPPSFGRYLRHLRTTSLAPGATRPGGGMSRTDLAARSGVSAGYLIKLEQGTQNSPASDVVDRLADAMGLADLERQHLHDLIAYHHAAAAGNDLPIDGRDITQLMRDYVDGLTPHLSGFVDDAWNVLYCNHEYSRIYRHIDDPDVANVLKWFFMVPESRAIMVEWETEARLTVAWLRALMVRRPGSGLFPPLLEDLGRSLEFVHMWSLQEVFMGRHTPHMLVHDLDHGRDIRLLAQVHDWPDPTKALQLYLGIDSEAERPTPP